MLLTKEIEIEINPANKNRLEELGYELPRYYNKKKKRWFVKRSEKIKIKIQDVSKGSHVKVKIKCDHCGNISEDQYKNYYRYHDEELGDSCNKCRHIKRQRNYEIKYGDNWKEIVHNNIIDKMHINGYVYTSKPQREISNILQEKYETILEKRYNKYSIDIIVYYKNKPIAIEYDGMFWHSMYYRTLSYELERDRKINEAYPILHIKGNRKDEIPSLNLIEEKLETLYNESNVEYIMM